MSRNRLFFVIFIFNLSPELTAQRLPVQVYTTRDGLLSNSVSAIAQDTRGYLWIGTDEGVSVYDGYQFRNHRLGDVREWGRVNAVIESRSEPGTMWIATNGGGLVRFRRGVMEPMPVAGTMRADRVNSVVEGEGGTLWCATDDGIYRFRERSMTKVATPELSQYVSLVRDAQGRLWCSDEQRLWIFDERTESLAPADIPGVPDDSVLAVTPLPDSTVAVSVAGASVRIVRDKRVVHTIVLPTKVAAMVTMDHRGRYWTTTPSGLFLHTPPALGLDERLLTTNNGLPANEMTALFFDREDNVWCGTNGRGLTKIEPAKTTLFALSGLTGKAAVDTAGHLWAASDHGLYEFFRDTSDRWQRQYHLVGSTKGYLSPVALAFDARGRLWCTVPDGALQCVSVKRTPHSASDLKLEYRLDTAGGFPKALTVTLMADRRNRLWYCMKDGGAAVVDVNGPPRLLQRFDYPSQTSLRDVREFSEDARGRVWGLGFDPGVETFVPDGDGYRQDPADTVRALLPYGTYRSAVQTRGGAFWFGTRYGGLVRIAGGTVRRYTTADGMLTNQIWSLHATEEGGLLIGSQAGVMAVPDETDVRFLPVRSAVPAPVNTVWSHRGTSYAVTRFEAVAFETPVRFSEPVLPPVQFTSLTVNGQERPLSDEELRLSAGENTVSLEYTAVRFSEPGALLFQYRLEPADTGWHTPTMQRAVTFASLPPGGYRFLVRTTDRDGNASAETSQLVFDIAAPYWRQWWFLSGAAALFIALLAGAERIRVRRLLELEKMRSRIAADLHDDIGSGLTRIALISDLLRRQAEGSRGADDPRFSLPALTEKVGSISRELVDAMGDVVFSIDPKNMSMQRLLHRVTAFTTEMCEAREMALTIRIAPGTEHAPVGSDSIRTVLLIVKEAVTNAVRHSGARSVTLSVEHRDRWLTLTVADDGAGFLPDDLPRMNGLTNMRQRAEKAGGTLTIDTRPGEGAAVTARIPAGR